jgi:predicted TIM-barrel fold metal-dependent hydrolase
MQTPWGEAKVADAHVHFFTRKFLGALGSQCGKTAEQVAEAAGWDLPPQDAAALASIWAAELDRNGVERAALIASVPGDENSVRAAVTAFPERFYAYAMVNPVAGERASIAGLHAICLFPAMHRYAIADPRVEALLEEAALQPEGRRPAIFVHCGVLTVGIRRKLGLVSPFDMRFSNPIDLHPVAQRYPQVHFVAPHFGAGYFREALMLTDLCPNVYLDTSSSNSWMRYEGLDLKTVFRRALNVAGPRRLLFGTDSSFFPRGWNREIYDVQVNALREIGLGAGDARLVLGENLARILG